MIDPLPDGIYAIVDRGLTDDPLGLLDEVLAGGVRVVQYRAKRGVERAVVRAMHARTRAAGGLLIVNDDVDAADDADGWHAGQEDLAGRDVAALRMRLAGRIFGVSCATPAEAVRARAWGADYLGTGPFRATGTKRDAGPAIGAAGIAAVVRATPLPVAAIGGIGVGDLPEVAATGARLAAVASAIARAPDPLAAARAFVTAWSTLR